uniref:Uncharacterized protein n=2 Tax=Anopheles arabiensis TaxID=7173 RepID=A0A182HYB2_ANOAR
MFAHKIYVLLPLVLFSTTNKVRGIETNDTNACAAGFALGMVASKLQTLQDKLMEMDSTIRQLSEKVGRNHKMLLTQLEQSNQLVLKKDLDLFMINSGINLNSFAFRSCKENPSKRSGKYILQLTENDQPFLGYCEQTAYGGGWLVFQYRYDGSVDFYRNWTEYRDGFGSVDGEFWLGLEHLHRMTSTRKHELLVELKDFEGNYKYARYDEFEIDSEVKLYALMNLGSYKGSVDDSLTRHKGMNFTTKDRDNDTWNGGNCAQYYHGGWWYWSNRKSNLNGMYRNSYDEKNMVWDHFKDINKGLAYSRMMIRET